MANKKNTLRLIMKAQWYELIESGSKKEEYREIKDFWIKRLSEPDPENPGHYRVRRYEYLEFVYGYTSRTMTFKCDGIRIGFGNPAYGGDPDYKTFIISIGERVK